MLMNPRARRARRDLVGLKAAIADAPALDGPEIVLTESSDEAAERAARAAAEGRKLVVAAGGDGTVHAVVNGLMGADEGTDRPTLAVVPLGTGNDLARSLGLPPEPREALRHLASARRTVMDVLRVRGAERPPFFCANVVAGGFGGQVEDEMTDAQKEALGPLAYLQAALKMITRLRVYRIRVRLDDGECVRLAAYSVVVCNGRFAAGGIPIAPRARLDDGLLNVVLVPAGHLADAGRLAAHIAAGTHLDESEKIQVARARRVEISSEPGMPYSMDGELTGPERRALFEVVPGALEVLAGEAREAAL